MKMRALLVVAVGAYALFSLLPARPTTAAAAAEPNGKAIFLQRCSACHSATGLGTGPYPPLAGNPDLNAADTAGIINTVLHGRTGPIQINGVTYSGTMPAWTGVLTSEELAAVLTYVRSAWTNKAAAITADQVAAAQAPMALSGAQLFAQKCATCHQSAGQGTTAYPPLAGNPEVLAADAKMMIGIIVNGRSGPLSVNGKAYDGKMPTWKGLLSNADIAAVATYVRSSWGNNASGVTESQVANAGTPVSTAVGASIYAKRCTTCHAANGQGGGGGVFPALAGNPHVTASDASPMLGTIVHGRNVMPSWKGQLSAAEIAAVATYIRSAWGNKAGPVTNQDVAAIK
jgi:cbb3-type cytochrome c oxidase subunit III